MKRLQHSPLLGTLAALALLLGCGGNVNLGGKGTGDDDSTPNDDAPATTEPDPSASASVINLPGVELGNLAVAGDYLYFDGYIASPMAGIYRCDKDSCKATLKLLLKGAFGFPHVVGDRLGVGRFDDASFDLMTFALPDASSPQVILSDLPDASFSPPLFTKDFVYFALLMDRNIYRCALPDCAGGPQPIAPTRERSYVDLEADAGQLLWSDNSFIYRAGEDGLGPVETLLPDAQLSAAPADAWNPDMSPADGVNSIAVQDGMLYASVARSQTGTPCDSSCPHEIVGWPLNGGPSQVFFRSDTLLRNVAIFDGELVWLGPSTTAPGTIAATMSTCRVEACEATHRELGQVRAETGTYAADEHYLYWFETKGELMGDVFKGFQVHEIRRSPRLPKP